MFCYTGKPPGTYRAWRMLPCTSLQAAIFIAALFRGVFFAPGRSLASAAFAALINAHLFLVAAMIARLPASDSLRFFFRVCDATGSAWYFTFCLCAAPMRLRAAALVVRRFRCSATTVMAGPASLPWREVDRHPNPTGLSDVIFR